MDALAVSETGEITTGEEQRRSAESDQGQPHVGENKFQKAIAAWKSKSWIN